MKKPIKIRSVVVMGSRARGGWKPWSDVDVLVVAEDLPKGLERLEVLRVLEEEVVESEVEVRAYTSDEFKEALKGLSLTALDAVSEGVAIYDDGFWEEMERYFKEVKKAYRLRKDKVGWTALKPL